MLDLVELLQPSFAFWTVVLSGAWRFFTGDDGNGDVDDDGNISLLRSWSFCGTLIDSDVAVVVTASTASSAPIAVVPAPVWIVADVLELFVDCSRSKILMHII